MAIKLINTTTRVVSPTIEGLGRVQIGAKSFVTILDQFTHQVQDTVDNMTGLVMEITPDNPDDLARTVTVSWLSENGGQFNSATDANPLQAAIDFLVAQGLGGIHGTSGTLSVLDDETYVLPNGEGVEIKPWVAVKGINAKGFVILGGTDNNTSLDIVTTREGTSLENCTISTVGQRGAFINVADPVVSDTSFVYRKLNNIALAEGGAAAPEAYIRFSANMGASISGVIMNDIDTLGSPTVAALHSEAGSQGLFDLRSGTILAGQTVLVDSGAAPLVSAGGRFVAGFLDIDESEGFVPLYAIFDRTKLRGDGSLDDNQCEVNADFQAVRNAGVLNQSSATPVQIASFTVYPACDDIHVELNADVLMQTAADILNIDFVYNASGAAPVTISRTFPFALGEQRAISAMVVFKKAVDNGADPELGAKTVSVRWFLTTATSANAQIAADDLSSFVRS